MKALHRRKRVGPQTERASQFSRAKKCAGWAPHWLHSRAQPARWVNFGSFAKACHGKSFYSGFLLFLEQQRAHKCYSLTKKSGAYHTSFNHQRTTKLESNAKMYVNQRHDKMAQTWKHILRHELFRVKYRYVGVFFERRFNHFLLEGFSQTNGNRLVSAPRAHFRQKFKIDK